MASEIKPKHYENGEITVRWEHGKCYHAAECVKGLPRVFNPKRRPWIKLDEATSQQIVETVSKCPSGALSIVGQDTEPSGEPASITVIPTGPYRIKGNFEVHDLQGNVIETGTAAALCACGQSGNKPFCDGSHKQLPGYLHPTS